MKLAFLFRSAIVFALFPLILKAEILQVCPNCTMHSIREAVIQAKAGDTIEVAQGHYREGLTEIDKPLTLHGKGTTIVDGLNKEHVFYVRADNVTLDGFVIQNSGVSYIAEYAGVRVEESKHCKISNNRFVNNTYSIYLAKVTDCLVENNVMSGNAKNEVLGGNGLHLWYSSHIQAQKNRISGHRDGFYIEFSSDSSLEDNTSEKNLRYGMHFMYSHRNKYYRNIFTHNQSGVAVMYSRNIEMKRNHFEKSWGRTAYGLLLKDITDSLIEENEFVGNTVGIFADAANRILFLHNNFKSNGWGVDILGNSDSNIFEENNFIHNYFNITTNTQSPLNTFRSNYWSDYQGYDLNHDGLGDIPFRPMKIFSLWINHYPELVAMLNSPVIEFLEVAEKVFPVLTPKALQDEKPRMKPFLILP